MKSRAAVALTVTTILALTACVNSSGGGSGGGGGDGKALVYFIFNGAGAKGIILNAVDESVTGAAKQVSGQLPVVTIDRDLSDPSGRIAFIGSDDKLLGRQLAAAARRVPEHHHDDSTAAGVTGSAPGCGRGGCGPAEVHGVLDGPGREQRW